MAHTILVPTHRELIPRFFSEAMHDKTGYADTHPSLVDRLAALAKLPSKTAPEPASSAIPQLLGTEQDHAAHYYLGKTCDELCDQLNREWAEHIKETWKRNYDEKQAAQARVVELWEKSIAEPLSEDELWEYATKTDLLEGATAAIPLFRQLLDRSPDHASANFALGRLLLAQGDRAGLERLEQAGAKDPEAFLAASALAEEFLIRTGQENEAAKYREQAMERCELLLKVEEERQHVEPDDVFLPHDLSREETRNLANELSALAEVGEAYLTRKQVRVMPAVPAYVLVVIPRYRWYEWREDAKNDALLEKLSQEITLPSNTYILVLGSQMKRQWKKKALKRIPPLPFKPGLNSTADSTPETSERPSFVSRWLYWMKRRWPEFAVIVAVLALFSNFSAHPEPNCTDHPTGLATNQVGSRTLYLVPIGDFPHTTLSRLTAHYTDTWRIPVTTLPPLPLEDESLWDPSRKQLVAERVIERMKRQLAELAAQPDAIVIGVTAQDMYREQSSWQYVFSHREGGRYAVVSSARMHPRTLPLHLPHGPLFSLDQRDEDLAQCRLTKMVEKNVGLLYYQLAVNNDPGSML